MAKRILGNKEPIVWDKFKKVFFKKYFTRTVRRQKEFEFIQLRQGNMKLWSMRLSSLSCPVLPLTLYLVKPGKNSIFLKKGKTVILVESHKFSRSRMMKWTSPLNSSLEI